VTGYRVEAVVGQGSDGTVYRGRRRRGRGRAGAGQVVAVKRLGRSAGPQVVERLKREAAVLASLDHPHVVRILDLVADGNGAAMAMEYAAGGSLATLLARRGRLRPEEAVAVAVPLADALAAVHRRGLVHGDVKPANVLFTAAGAPVLADFGLAAPSSDPADGPVAGTEAYVDPAVAGGAKPDERSDVYALGAVCHEMLSGQPHACSAASEQASLGPPELEAVVKRSVASRPRDRFPDMAAMGAALRAVAGSLPVPSALFAAEPDTGDLASGVDEAGPPTHPLGARSHRPTTGPEPGRRSPRRRPAVMVGTAAALVLAAGLAVAVPTLVAPRLAGTPARPRPRPCPAVTSTMQADLDGDGCPSAVTVAGNVVEIEGQRYQLGRQGDTVLIGDWDCDGRDTPALYRPGGEVFLFDGWAAEGQVLPAASRGEHVKDGRPEVQHGEDGCDNLSVR